VASFSYRPAKCKKDYRVVALRKDLSVERGEDVLFSEYRYFFYITNDWAMTDDQVVAEARGRCDQENLIAQLKGGARALHAPVNTLNANWAYMVNFPLPAGHLGPASAGGGWRYGKGCISTPVHRRVQEGRGGAVTLIGPANKGGGQAVGHIGHLA
jgi:hypothetical protein